ncbi:MULTISPECIES: hypothetical protein [Pseudomonas]|uniref:hypothetical protein n=2 Tax=Pseudomonas TaxID=286 RepID=UPI0021154220|nr:hypothetical protein [Pseudomonas sp. OIL-1]
MNLKFDTGLRYPDALPVDGPAMTYLAIKTLHLLAAATFIGSLFFQIFVLWPASRQLPAQSLSELDQSVRRRFMLVIHLVALVLYGAGFGLLTNYWKHLQTPFSSNFSMLLSLKLILATSIIVHYLALAATRRRAPVGPVGMRWINISLLLHAALIVVCAKAMFML